LPARVRWLSYVSLLFVSAGTTPPRPGQILARGLAADAPGRRLISVAAYITGSGSLPSFDDASLQRWLQEWQIERQALDRQALDFIRSIPAGDTAIVRLQPGVYELRFVFPRAYPDTASNATKLELMASSISADLARRAKAAGLAGPRFDPCPRPLPRWPRQFVQHGLEHEPKQWLERFGLAPPSADEIEAFEKAEAAEVAAELAEVEAVAPLQRCSPKHPRNCSGRITNIAPFLYQIRAEPRNSYLRSRYYRVDRLAFDPSEGLLPASPSSPALR
jgi:hypothetical protein